MRTSIIFHKTGRFEVETGITIFEAAKRLGIYRGEHGHCPSCMVWILGGEQNCSPMEEEEARILAAHQLQPPIRLSCATRILGPMRVQTLFRDETEAEKFMADLTSASPIMPGTQRPLVLFNTCLHGFETLAAKCVAYDCVRVLQEFRAKYELLLHEHNGTLCEAGNAVAFAVFGLHENLEAAIANAMGAARRLSVDCKGLCEYAARHGDVDLNVGIGIHVGEVGLGQIGSVQQSQWAVFGEARQIAERLLALTASAKASILVSEPIFAVIRERFPITRAFAARMPGREQRNNVFEVQTQSTGFLAEMAF